MLCLCVACATSVTPDDPSTVPKNDASRNNVSSPARLSDGAKQAVLRNGPQRIRNPYASPSSHKTPLSRLALTGTATKSSSIDARKGGTIRSAFHGTPTPKSQMPKSLYISMGEGGNSSQISYRLRQIADVQQQEKNARFPTFTLSLPSTNDSVLSRILTRFVRNSDEFTELVDVTLPTMLATKLQKSNNNEGGRIGLVVLDSMAGLFRLPENLQQNQKSLYFAKRSNILFNCSAKLKKLSHQYNVPIVVVNQVTASFSSSSSNFSLQKLHMSCSMERMMPLLGLSWSNCVNTRFLLTRNETTENYGKSSSIIRFVRHAHVLLSSQMPFGTVEFIINAGGGIIV
mmetsp:Transcript_26466/g.35270  ORF Transcript_26466/g.35270 Transcript_26466/m.35270 type:complete len:344 (+) Transcript_26466:480-1511(+)